jgi:hypothetical protein
MPCSPAVTTRVTAGARPLGGLTRLGVSDTGVVLTSSSADDPSALSREGPFVGTRVQLAAAPSPGRSQRPKSLLPHPPRRAPASR